MKVFQIIKGINAGAPVMEYRLKAAPITIDAIVVGEEGRGRRLGLIPVELRNKRPEARLMNATLGQTRSGKPKLIEVEADDAKDCIVVLKTPIGYRGGNDHTGDRIGWKCFECGQGASGFVEKPEGPCPFCGANRDGVLKYIFKPFPLTVLCDGIIAQGDAGRMGSGTQMVCVAKPGDIWRVWYYGRHHNESSYYRWDGETLIGLTADERLVTDAFVFQTVKF